MKVIIVGAGVVGITTAYYLEAEGHEVTVVERQDRAGMETSFANAGQLCRYTARPWAGPSVPAMIFREMGRASAPYLVRLRFDPQMWRWLVSFLAQCRTSKYQKTRSNLLRIAIHSSNLMDDLIARENIDFDHCRYGVLHLFQDQKSLDHASEDERRFANADIRGETLDYASCVAIEPALNQCQTSFAGGILHQHEQTGDAHQFTAKLARILADRGVSFEYGVEVQKFITEGESVSSLITNGGTIKADAIVIGAATNSAKLLSPMCPNLPIYPVKGYSITIPTGGYNGAPKIGIHDSSRKIGFSRLGDRLRVAGTAEFGAPNTQPSQSRIEALRDRARTIFPGAGNFEAAQTWAGLRPMTPDGAPVLGQTKWKNLFVNTGHGSLGWSLACGSGRILADLLAGRTPGIDLSGLTVDRFF